MKPSITSYKGTLENQPLVSHNLKYNLVKGDIEQRETSQERNMIIQYNLQA
jgi:hypothetical protein